MRAEQNELMTRIGPGTACGALMRSYWQPLALVDEFDPALDPRMAGRPVKAVRALGQDFVLFRNRDGAWGLQLIALRPMTGTLTHVRVTNAIFPHTFVIPLSETLTITQMHLPVDDEHTYWYSIFTSFAGPVDREAMRSQRLRYIDLPDYTPKSGRHNQWGFNPQEQLSRTFLGMGEDDINVHDQWAVESMGAIQDRTREHLGTTDKVIMANRRMLLQAIETVRAGGSAPGVADTAQAAAMVGPDTVDGIAPAGAWDRWWHEQVRAKRNRAPWRVEARE